MVSPKVSVIIPIYQSARYLRDTLQSLVEQTYFQKSPEAVEVHLIVDGECEDFKDMLPPEIAPRLEVHKIAHRGVSGARNFGIEKSAGEYVAFLDADDTWLPEKLARQVDLMDKNPAAGMCYTNSFWIDKSGRVLSRTQKEQYGRLPTGFIALDMMERDYIITSSVLVRKSAFKKVGVFDTALEVCEDWELKIRISKAFPVLMIEKPLIHYRLHAGGSHYKCERMLECGFKVFDRHASELADDGNGRMGKLKANVPLNLAGSWLYIDRPQEARRYLKESLSLKGGSARLYLMYALSFMPKFARDILLWVRDKVPALP